MNYKKDYKYIIGLDLSLTSPGWAKYTVENKELTYGSKDFSKYRGMFRIQEILDAVTDQFEEPEIDSKTTDYLLILEGYSFGSKGSSAISLGELGGVIRHYLWRNTYDNVEVPPTTAKKFLTGSGAAGKAVILKELYKHYQIDVNDDNIADAINLCMIGRAYTGNLDKKLTKEQEKIVEAIFNPKEKKSNG